MASIRTGILHDGHTYSTLLHPGMPSVLAIARTEDKSPITIVDFIAARPRNRKCNEQAKQVGFANTSFRTDTNGLFIRTSRIDQAEQVVVPPSLQARILYLSHHPLFAGHPGGTKMYKTLRRNFYRRNIANDLYQTVQNCRSCAAQTKYAKQVPKVTAHLPSVRTVGVHLHRYTWPVA